MMTHNLAQSGSLRRKLGIPNPVHFCKLAAFVVDNWQDLYASASRSHLSLTTPVDGYLRRAIERQYDLTERPVRRAQLRSTSRYILQADISRFYPSIYTHSIPWALHTKAIAKRNRSDQLLGNQLDRLVRHAQDDQTMGIPIGPDTSLLIAEILLAAVDEALRERGITRGFRYIDDYEIGFQTLSDAEAALSHFQEVLNEYELALNPNKTRILKLPLPAEPLAISELRTFLFRPSIPGQRSDLLRYFDRAFYLANDNPEEHILKYAIARLSGIDIHSSNWSLVENLLLQCLVAESGTMPLAQNQFLRYRDLGFALDRDRIGEALGSAIAQHSSLGHGSEVAWGLWCHLVLGIRVSSASCSAASFLNDSIAALLLLDAHNKGLVSSAIEFRNLPSVMTTDELYGEHWLLSYEANVKGWLPSEGTSDHVSDDRCFALLKNSGVYFYDDTVSDHIGYEAPGGWAERY